MTYISVVKTLEPRVYVTSCVMVPSELVLVGSFISVLKMVLVRVVSRSVFTISTTVIAVAVELKELLVQLACHA